MSNKISIKELLNDIEVEWKALGKITKVLRGKRLTRSQLSDSEKFPVYHGGLEPLGNYGESNRPANSTMVINVGASAGTVGYSSVDFWSSDGCFCIEHSNLLNNKFLYYFLIGQQHFLCSKVRTAGIPTLDAFVIEKIEVPIPYPNDLNKSLNIQNKIVQILDNFTELTTELTAELTTELTARKKQYSYYLDKLFAFEDTQVEFKPLGEIGELVRGNGLPKSDFTETGVPAIHYGQIYTYYGTATTETKSFVSPETAKKLRKVNKGDVIITNTSENLEDVGKALSYFGELEAVTGGHATIFKPSNQILGKYFTYYTQTSMFFSQKMKYAKGAKVIDVSATDLAKFQIPIPYPNDRDKSFQEQQRIVDILDKFDTLTNSISEELPKEIKLREQQYEYYRDLLLTFPKDKEVE